MLTKAEILRLFADTEELITDLNKNELVESGFIFKPLGFDFGVFYNMDFDLAITSEYSDNTGDFYFRLFTISEYNVRVMILPNMTVGYPTKERV